MKFKFEIEIPDDAIGNYQAMVIAKEIDKKLQNLPYPIWINLERIFTKKE